MPKKHKAKAKPELTPRQAKFVEEFMKDGNQTRAGKVAGIANPHYMTKTRAVRAALDDVREKSIVAAAYNADAAMKEADEAIQFARDTENANAFVKAVELKAKLQGLLIEKHQHMGMAPLTIQISGIDDPKPAIDVTSTPVEGLPAPTPPLQTLPTPEEDPLT